MPSKTVREDVLRDRIRYLLRGKYDCSVLCLGPDDVDRILDVVEDCEISNILNRNTEHYLDCTQDVVVYTTGFDDLTIWSKHLTMRGVIRVMKIGGVFILCMTNLKQDLAGMGDYLLDLGCSIARCEKNDDFIYMEIQKNASRL